MPHPPRAFWAIVFGIFLVVFAWLASGPKPDPDAEKKAALAKKKKIQESITTALEMPISLQTFPGELTVSFDDKPESLRANYTIDWLSQGYVEKLLKSYKPDYAAFVAMDADTGRILTMTSYTREVSGLGNLVLRATFPAASIFKIVTASAAIDQRRANPETIIGYNGANHTLYRRNVTQTDSNRWTRYITLSQAFAKSINTVFAKVGLYFLDPSQLREYAERFKFNESIHCDLKAEASRFILPDNDQWAVAEAASGFNRGATLSPLHGAMLAASIANEGIMMTPYLVDTLLGPKAEVRYRAESRPISQTIEPASAAAMRALMRETVKSGTSRSAFRTLFQRRGFSDIEIGGKTGSLQGEAPKGKYDWFVGYALGRGRKIAIASLTINEENWRVKSSVLARSYIEHELAQKK